MPLRRISDMWWDHAQTRSEGTLKKGQENVHPGRSGQKEFPINHPCSRVFGIACAFVFFLTACSNKPPTLEEQRVAAAEGAELVDVSTIKGKWGSINEGVSRSVIEFDGSVLRLHMPGFPIPDHPCEFKVLGKGQLSFHRDSMLSLYLLGTNVQVLAKDERLFLKSSHDTYEYARIRGGD